MEARAPFPPRLFSRKLRLLRNGEVTFSIILWGFRKLIRVESGCNNELGDQRVVYLGSGKRVNPGEVESQGEAKSQSVFPNLVSQPYQEVPPQVSLLACFSYSRMRQTRTISMIEGGLC